MEAIQSKSLRWKDVIKTQPGCWVLIKMAAIMFEFQASLGTSVMRKTYVILPETSASEWLNLVQGLEWQICYQSRLISSFDVLCSEWSWITNADYPKGLHPCFGFKSKHLNSVDIRGHQLYWLNNKIMILGVFLTFCKRECI